jgi:hypothetical protein
MLFVDELIILCLELERFKTELNNIERHTPITIIQIVRFASGSSYACSARTAHTRATR